MAETVIGPGVTVVVPTLNRGAYLLDTVRDLLAQAHRPLEILLVDQSDAVSPELEALVVAHPDIVSHRRVTFRGLPIARNYGWQMARHELIVYVDDDIRCAPGFVAAYAGALMETGIGMCGGSIDEPANGGSRRIPAYNRWIAFPEGGFAFDGVSRVDHVKGCNFGGHREAFRAIGGFDERLNVGAALHEETDAALRATAAGRAVRYDGALRLTHLAAGTGGTRQLDYRRYVFALAHNRSVMVRRHSRWYQWPVGLAWSGKLIAAYTLHARAPRIILDGLRGMVQGWRVGGRPPVCTRFEAEGVA
jgi:GT2 family glycosyltransferase